MSEPTSTVRVPNVTPEAVSGLDHSPLYGDVEVTGSQLRPLDDDEERDGPCDPALHTDDETAAYLDSLDDDADRDEIARVMAALDSTEPIPPTPGTDAGQVEEPTTPASGEPSSSTEAPAGS